MLGDAILIILWVFGIVLARGFWSTFFAVIFPLWGWIVIASYVVKKYF